MLDPEAIVIVASLGMRKQTQKPNLDKEATIQTNKDNFFFFN